MGETEETSGGKKKRCKRASNDASGAGPDPVCGACGEAPCGKPCKRRHTGEDNEEEVVVAKKAALSDNSGLTRVAGDVRCTHNENDTADPEQDAKRTERTKQEKEEIVGENKSKESEELSPDAGTAGSGKDLVPGSDMDPAPGGLKRKASGVEARETKKVRISEDVQVHSAQTDGAGQTTKRHRHRQKPAAKELPELRVIPK